MNRRSFVSKAILATAFVALAASAASAGTPGKTLKLRPVGPKAPTGYAAPSGQDTSAAINHDPDAQLDIWVQKCNDAGGGMSTGGDGNYHCKDADGNEIEDY
jgi:hypothetical protein